MKKLFSTLSLVVFLAVPANLSAECVTVSCVSSNFCTVCTS